jgi:hypothetical protein
MAGGGYELRTVLRRALQRALFVLLVLTTGSVLGGCSVFDGIMGGDDKPASPTDTVGALRPYKKLCVVKGGTPKEDLRAQAFQLKQMVIQAFGLRDVFKHIVPGKKNPEDLEFPDDFDADEERYVIFSTRIVDGYHVADGGRGSVLEGIGDHAWFQVDVLVKDSDGERLDAFSVRGEPDTLDYGTTTDALEKVLDAILAWVENNR